MGLCKTSLGEINEGVDSYKKALQKNPNHKEAWFNLFQALKEVLDGLQEYCSSWIYYLMSIFKFSTPIFDELSQPMSLLFQGN